MTKDQSYEEQGEKNSTHFFLSQTSHFHRFLHSKRTHAPPLKSHAPFLSLLLHSFVNFHLQSTFLICSFVSVNPICKLSSLETNTQEATSY